MSISLGHRAIFTAFGHRSSITIRPHAPSMPAPSPQGDPAVPLDPAAPVETGELKCLPWEGLYLEQTKPITATGNEAAAGRQLESFLANLMYGE